MVRLNGYLSDRVSNPLGMSSSHRHNLHILFKSFQRVFLLLEKHALILICFFLSFPFPVAPSLIKLKQCKANRNTLRAFARSLNRNRETKQSTGSLLLLVFAKKLSVAAQTNKMCL